MKKKQLISIIVMVVCVAVLAAGYILMKEYNKNKSEKEAAENEAASATIDIYDINTEDVVGISYTNSYGTINMVYKDELWVDEETQTPMNSEYVQEMLDAVANYDAIRIIVTEASDVSEYGLDNPQLSYTITMSDGTKYNAKLGLQLVTETNGYYALLDSDTTVYTVSSNYFEPFTRSFTDMTDIADEVHINSDYVTGLNVSVKDGLDFEAKYIGDTTDENEYYTWEITKPYKNVRADTDTLTEKLSDFTSLTYDKCIEYSCDDMGKYGLKNPYATVTVDYYNVTGISESDEAESEDEAEADDSGSGDDAEATPIPEEQREYHTLKLYIGDSYDNGEDDSGYYVNPEGTDKVYTLSKETVDSMTGFTAFSMVDTCIYAELVDQMSGYDIEYKGNKYSIERKEEDSDNVYYVNGTKVDTDSLLTLYSAAYLLTLSGEAEQSLVKDDAEAVLTITYHTNAGEDVVVKYLTYGNENFYQVDNNGVDYFLTDKRGIDDLVSRYETFISDNNL
ncbi:MAG: DUF4340 domain-containing protein [Lachnospiraceae bacterium]|jgi:hypothetical protein